MKTIIVPTDFSAVSGNATLYAFGLAQQLKTQKIILYNTYQAPPILTETAMPIMPVMDLDTLQDISTQGMKRFRENVEQHLPAGVVLVDKTAFGIVSENIYDLCMETAADLVVMGISEASKLEEVLIGSTATSVINQTKTPVIIVPAGARYTAISNIVLACDYKNVVETTPVETIKNMLKNTGAKLHVVNVYDGERSIDGEKTYEQELVQSLFMDFAPQFHSIRNTDFMQGINQFVDEHQVDMIITIPKKHGFFDGLFKERHTKQLAFHSHVPLMSIHDKS